MKRLRRDMYACGEVGLPKQIFCQERAWQLDTVFKHDFFACTGRYQCEQTQELIVLKINRLRPFLYIPLASIGRFLCEREMNVLKQLQDIEQVPQLIKPYGRNGFIYRYIEGKSLDEKPELPDDFFDQLENVLTAIHQQNVCYMDMNKRGNILIGTDNKPYIIDFQISLFLPAKWCNGLKEKFRREDLYHLFKHKRRLRPDLLTQDERASSKRTSRLISAHRVIAKPFQKVRRSILRLLYKKNILKSNSESDRSPENDPSRFMK